MGSIYMDVRQQLLSMYGKYMSLKLFIDSHDDELVNMYIKSIAEHNEKICTDINHVDAGFDLFTPEHVNLTNTTVNKIDYKVSCSAEIVQLDSCHHTGFYMYPRSSISKTHLRLANNVGIIDAGYRGHLIGMFDLVYTDSQTSWGVSKMERHLQICAPGLIPIYVTLVSSLDDKTARGDGGFGSTGL